MADDVAGLDKEVVVVGPDLDLATNMAVLEPHLPMLHGCVQRGFAMYQDDYPAIVRAAHDNAAAAKNVHRHVLAEVTMACESEAGLTMLNARGLNVLNIQDRVVLRFKKMDASGRSVSYPTKQARDFDQQIQLPDLPPAATRLTFGYEPDLAFSMIVRILVACPYGGGTLWCAQVNEDLEGTASWEDITPRRLPGTERFKRYGTGDV